MTKRLAMFVGIICLVSAIFLAKTIATGDRSPVSTFRIESAVDLGEGTVRLSSILHDLGFTELTDGCLNKVGHNWQKIFTKSLEANPKQEVCWKKEHFWQIESRASDRIVCLVSGPKAQVASVTIFDGKYLRECPKFVD